MPYIPYDEADERLRRQKEYEIEKCREAMKTASSISEKYKYLKRMYEAYLDLEDNVIDLNEDEYKKKYRC